MELRNIKTILNMALLVFAALFMRSLAAEPVVHFQKKNIADGLSQSVVLAVLQDSQGFMWFGTYDGLNRYDGYQFKQFRYEPEDLTTVSNNAITVLFEDSKNRLWIGTEGGGLNLYDRKMQSFVRYRHNKADESSLSHDVITSINEDSQGRLWVGTLNGLNLLSDSNFIRISYDQTDPHGLSHNHITSIYKDSRQQMWIGTDGGGINRFDAISGQFFHFQNHTVDIGSISSNNVYAITEDRQGKMWFGTNTGLNVFDAEQQSFARFQSDSNNPTSLCDNFITDIGLDQDGHLWLGSETGLCKFSVAGKRLNRFVHQPSDASSLSSNSIRDIYFDPKGLLWVGTFGGGLNIVDIRQRQFGHYKHIPNNLLSLTSGLVFGITQTKKGDIWVGTSGGLNKQIEDTGNYKRVQIDSESESTLIDNYIWEIFEDSDETLWLGTNMGVTQFDEKNDRYKHNAEIHPALAILTNNSVVSILKAKNGVMWFGTWGGGLIRFNPLTGEVHRYIHDVNNVTSIANDVVLKVSQDSKGNIWVGTNNGLNRYDNNGGSEQFLHDKSEPGSLSQGYVMSIFEDASNDIWVGTSGGLNRLITPEVGFEHFEERHGLANRVINCITQDAEGLLWVSTNMGLSSFNFKAKEFKNYDVTHGLQSNEFNVISCMTSKDGELYFGGINGINRFYPDRLTKDTQPPVIAFTDAFLFNQRIDIHKLEHTDESIYHISEAVDQLTDMTLNHKQSLITFEFAALDYRSPANNRYQYMLYGYDEDWIESDANIRRATYTNLPSGDYTLWVRAANSDGYWNEQGTTINIHVTPPPWLSWWAFVLYTLAFSILVFGFINYRIHHNRMMHEVSVNKRLTELDRLKDTFLTNTSHELRTPLNGIIGLSESLIDGVAGRLPDRAVRNLGMVVSSGKRLANLVNDILDMSKLKHKGIDLHTQAIDMHSVVGIVLALSEPLMNEKQITLNNNVPTNLPPVEADEDRLLQIIHNLVGNAIKFTETGSVSVSAVVSGTLMAIKVRDTGIGIPQEQFSTIFEMFEQVEGEDNNRHYGGSGLGLAITKQLIELHKGNIDVDSEMEVGTIFTFTLPLSEKELQSKTQVLATTEIAQKIHTPEPATKPEWEIPLELTAAPQINTEVREKQSHDGSRFKILLVDDEPVNLQVINNHLSLHNYQMIEASSGAEALYLLDNDGPFDLVLLDVMMPKLSGFEVCKQIRQSKSVVQLPIIFLTAKSQVEDMVYGFEIGANDYINKPVSKHELLHRVDFHLRMHEISCNLERVIEDRTAQIVAAQKKLVLSDKLATLGTLMAGIAHEINNPTSFVNVCLYELEGDLKTCKKYIYDLAGPDAAPEILNGFSKNFDPLFKHMETMKEGLNRIKTIVKDLKTSSHMNDEEKSIVCITDIILSTVNLVSAKHKQNVTINTNFAATPFIKCYPARLNQVFMNLLVNACDALSAKTEGVIEVGCRLAGKKVEITIWDNGVGMTKETKEKLFEPFYTTKGIDKGTGLGLSISYDIVQRHGGEMTVDSEMGKGSRFRILLPV